MVCKCKLIHFLRQLMFASKLLISKYGRTAPSKGVSGLGKKPAYVSQGGQRQSVSPWTSSPSHPNGKLDVPGESRAPITCLEEGDDPGLVQCFSLKNKPEPVPPTAA